MSDTRQQFEFPEGHGDWTWGELEDYARKLGEALHEVSAAFDAFYAAPDRLTGLGELLNRERIVREALGA